MQEVVNNSVQINNSVTVNDQFLAEITTMLHRNDHDNAEKKLQSALRMISNAHIDPDWDYRIQYNNNEIIIVEYPRDDAVLKGLPQKLNVEMVIPEELKYLGDINSIIQYGKNRQITLEIELRYFKRYAGDHLIEHVKSTTMHPLIMVIEPEPFPSFNVDLIFGDNYYTLRTLLQVTQVREEGVIEVSNKNDHTRLIDYKLTLDINSKKGLFNFSIPEIYKNKTKGHFAFNQIMHSSVRNRHLCISSESMGSIITTTLGSPEGINLSTLESELELLSALMIIEEKFDIQFSLPNIIEKKDFQDIFTINEIIKTGVMTIKINEISFDFNEFNSLRKLIHGATKKQPMKLTFSMEEKYQIFGQELDLGKIEAEFSGVYVKDWEQLQRKIEVLSEGDMVKVDLVAGSNGVLVKKYLKFL